MNNNKLILGDCLEVMKKLEDESIDLIYLDPPFFSNRNYEVIWGDEGEIRSFEDRWSGGIDQYINWLYDRVKEMHRLLKPTGSIYLHCDWHADAYIRVQILDKIFKGNFRNEIIWYYPGGLKSTYKIYPRKHDNILFYTKSNKYNFILPRKETTENVAFWNRWGKYSEDGETIKLKHIPLTDVINRERQIKKFTNQNKRPPTDEDVIYKLEGAIVETVWADCPAVYRMKEKIGYPTQKPLALLDRIIKASSNEGDVVLDPFMGGGTTMVMASRLGRNFIGIDQSIAAVDVTDKRLQADGKQLSIQFSKYEIEKHYYAEEDLRAMDPFEFERWIVTKFGGKPNEKQRGDFGLDGEKDGVPVQVKNWKNKVGRIEIDKFQSACRRVPKFKQNLEKGVVGYFIAFDFAKEAVGELARLKMDEGIIIEKVLVSDIVPMAKRPIVRIEWSRTADGKYEFRAISDSNILNYSWDFAYSVPAHKHPEDTADFKPTVLRDNTGVRVHNFASNGTHNIAVKVVDDKYLENIAVCSISI